MSGKDQTEGKLIDLVLLIVYRKICEKLRENMQIFDKKTLAYEKSLKCKLMRGLGKIGKFSDQTN